MNLSLVWEYLVYLWRRGWIKSDHVIIGHPLVRCGEGGHDLQQLIDQELWNMRVGDDISHVASALGYHERFL